MASNSPIVQKLSNPMPNSPCTPAAPFSLEAALDRIADMRGDVAEVRSPVAVARHPGSVVANAQILPGA